MSNRHTILDTPSDSVNISSINSYSSLLNRMTYSVLCSFSVAEDNLVVSKAAVSTNTNSKQRIYERSEAKQENTSSK